jgi:hypothetical protein
MMKIATQAGLQPEFAPRPAPFLPALGPKCRLGLSFFAIFVLQCVNLTQAREDF